jgi:lysophospholipase L1-like esterase
VFLFAVTPVRPIAVTEIPSGGVSLVVMGDSYAANGDVAAAMMAAQGWTSECKHSPTSWPSQLAQRMRFWYRRDFADVSCLGASLVTGPGYSLAQETKKAYELGALGSRTRVVAIQLGMNDAWGDNPATVFQAWMSCLPDLQDGCGVDAAMKGRSPDFRGVTGQAYADRIRSVVTYIRYYAPNARIVLVGYPELNTPGQQAWCLDLMGITRFTQDRAGAMTEYMDRLDQAQREAARVLNLEFFSTRAITAGHGFCSPEPWLNGLLLVRRELFGIPFHPTVGGDAIVAAAMQQRWFDPQETTMSRLSSAAAVSP